MTRVMFSRGNITEKIRFGKLVQKGDIVLDVRAHGVSSVECIVW